jgi:hypothetical protein
VTPLAVALPERPPVITPTPARTLLTILRTAARDDAGPLEGPGVDDPTSPKEGITHERTAA